MSGVQSPPGEGSVPRQGRGAMRPSPSDLRLWLVLTRREVLMYVRSPIALIFMIVFLLLAGSLAFFLGGFVERNQADLLALFSYLPWLLMVTMPALAMRLWSDEISAGTTEVLFALPVSDMMLTTAKFAAAWLVSCVIVMSTGTFWISVNLLGEPDNFVILGGYLASLLLCGVYLVIGMTFSALTRNQVIAFVVSTACSFFLTVAGAPIFTHFFRDWLPYDLTVFLTRLSLIARYQTMVDGELDLRDVAFYLSFIVTGLAVTTILVMRLRGRGTVG